MYCTTSTLGLLLQRIIQYCHFTIPRTQNVPSLRITARSSMSISSQSLGKKWWRLTLSMLDSLDAYAQTLKPTLQEGQNSSALQPCCRRPRQKTTRGAPQQSICGVAAWVTGAAKSTGISASRPAGLLVFIEGALHPPGRLRKHRAPLGAASHVCDSWAGN
jgi:hypothetical protein